MRKNIKLPAPQLSQLKEINLDLDMTGRHYSLLASCDGQLPEDVALSILKDLMEEDANKLTLAELRYLFMLVKINSLENEYIVNVTCSHKNKNGEECGHVNEVKIFLSDADLNPTPSNYAPPRIKFRTKDTEKEYTVMPPTMNKESQLYNYFLVERGENQDAITSNKKSSFDYTYLHSILHLVDDEGNRFVKDTDKFDDLFQYLDCNKYQTITELYEKVYEVGSFGVQNKVYEIECKECGGRIIFQLPLLNGLVD